MIFDTHAHYDDPRFDEDREELLKGLKENNVGLVVNVGANESGSVASVELSQKWDFIYASVGVHPDDTDKMTEDTIAHLDALSEEKKTVAIGEIGLDYNGECVEHEIQKKWFIRQLQLAQEKKMPVIIHSRDAANDTFQIVKDYIEGLRKDASRNAELLSCPGVIHCFSYEKEMAREYVKMGFMIGIGGVSTFKNGRKLKEVIDDIPLEALVLETDSPYLSPEPMRGQRNDSTKLKYVVLQIASIKEISTEDVEKVTFQNAKKMYRLM